MSPLSSSRVLVIAEAGVNHNGDPETAFALVDAAAAAEADAVKFQTFSAEALVSADAPKAAYQQANTGSADSQLAMLKSLELPNETFHALKARCAEKGIAFLSTPFDPLSLAFLLDEMKLETVKVSSGDITNGPLLWRMAEAGARVILSTGASTPDEVAEALGVLALGYAGRVPQGRAALAAALDEAALKADLAEKVVLLHCSSDYPTRPEDVNLKAMRSLGERFGVPVGYSDHSEGIAVATAAVALGARVIEKHFTLDRSLPGPDHKASLEPDQLAQMVQAIRIVEAALGDGEKRVMAGESANRTLIRKSLVAARDLEVGTVTGPEDLLTLRPGDGRSAMDWWDVLGKPLAAPVKRGERLP